MSNFKSWGVVRTSAIPYSNGFRCLDCGWDFLASYDNIRKYIVGFELAEKPIPSLVPRFPKIGMVIVECPKCFEKFWFHLSESVARAYRAHCPAWPK